MDEDEQCGDRVVMVLGASLVVLVVLAVYEPVVAALACVAGLVVLVVIASKEARYSFSARRRAAEVWEQALLTVPPSAGVVMLRGRVHAHETRLEAPFSKRACVAYWGVHHDRDSESSTTRHWREATEFVLEVGGERVLVEARRARVVGDPDWGEAANDDSTLPDAGVFVPVMDPERAVTHRELLLCEGDEAAVSGVLLEVPRDSDDPYRMSQPLRFHLVSTEKQPLEVVVPERSRRAGSGRVIGYPATPQSPGHREGPHRGQPRL